MGEVERNEQGTSYRCVAEDSPHLNGLAHAGFKLAKRML
jgi:Family of unknown function (DUF5641)